MKAMRKIALAIIIALMFSVLSLFAACNGNDNPPVGKAGIKLSFETNGGGRVETVTVQEGETYSLPSLDNKTQNGETYMFDGWCLDSDLSGEVLNGNITVPSEDTEYYAKWTRVYKISFYSDRGKLDIEYIYIRDGEKLFDAIADVMPSVEFGYNFDGWYLNGARVTESTDMPKTDITLIARYSVVDGIEDALGGSDILFKKSDEPGVIYLLRQGVETKKGEYDPATGIFSFGDGKNEILAGKITGKYFYYFNEKYIGEFKTADGTKSLTIGERYIAVFNDGKDSEDGEVIFDRDSGYFVFKGNRDAYQRFIFSEGEDGSTVFVLQNMEEAGSYHPENSAYPIITLDGLGNFTYTFDPAHPTYYDISGAPLLEAEGSYTINEDGDYECSMSAGGTHLEDFVFRVVGENTFKRSDFFGDLDPIEHTLFLNGFGEGTYKDEAGVVHEGTYDIIHEWWMTQDGRDAQKTWLINFEYDGAEEDIYYALMQDRYGNVTAMLFGKVTKGQTGGLYIFDGAITIGGEVYSDAFIMLLVDAIDESMVLVKMDDQSLSSGELVGVYAPMYSGTVTVSRDLYHFEDTKAGTQMNFKIENGKAVYSSNTGDGTLEKRTIAEGLEIDPNTSTATYTDEEGKLHTGLSYTYSTGEYLEFYTVKLDSTHNLYYYRDLHGDEEMCTQISGKFIFDYAYMSEEVANAFPARLLLDENSSKAYIAIPMAIGEAEYVGEGSYVKLSENEYRYENRFWANNLLDYFGGDGFQSSLDLFVEYYENFTFRTLVGADDSEISIFYERDDNMFFQLDNFKADGYSDFAEYTTDSGDWLTGKFYRMEIIIVFDSDNGQRYYLKQDGNKMKNVSEDAGLYYLYTPDDVFFMTFGPESGSIYYDYIVFDGENRVTIVNFENGYLANAKQGSMEKTPSWRADFREYTVTEEETGSIYKILLGSFETIWHDEFLVYDLYSEAYTGDWYTEEGGRLQADGYRIHNSTYDVDDDGNPEYSGLMVRARFDKTDIQTHAYTEDPEGDVIVFTYTTYESNGNEVAHSIVFNVVEGAGGMQYLVERKLTFGAFAFWEAGVRPGNYMYLDGNGIAELYDGTGNLIGTGTYGLAPDISEVSYYYRDDADANSNFYFAIYIESEDGGSTYFEYRRYNSDVFGEYDADDWSHLSVSYYGEITYIDRYGVIYEGYYSVDGNKITLITYDGSGITFTFFYDRESGYFQLADDIGQ